MTAYDTDTAYAFAWSTNQEIAFLSKLGTYTATPRKRLLQGYLDAIPKRVRWDNIDKEAVTKAARQMLIEERYTSVFPGKKG